MRYGVTLPTTAVLGVVALAPIAHAAVLLEAGGWRVEADAALDVNVTRLSPMDDVLRLRKEAVFSGVSGITGLPDGIVLTFTQIADDADTLSRVTLDEESATNNTGQSWGRFMMALFGGPAVFNVGESGGFAEAPFPDVVFSPDATDATFSGGSLADGETWTPGDNGDLVIDIDLSDDMPVVFSLKELPVPAPGAAVMIGIASVLVARRRRA